MATVKKTQKNTAKKKLQTGGGVTPYKPLSNRELSALAHQYRGYLNPDEHDYSRRDDSKDSQGRTSGFLTKREKEQLKSYMKSRTVGQKLYEALPNVRGSRGESTLPKNSRLNDEFRSRSFASGTSKDLDIVEANLQKLGYKNGGKVSKKSAPKKVAKSGAKVVKKSAKKK
jgi:hypothetical protein